MIRYLLGAALVFVQTAQVRAQFKSDLLNEPDLIIEWVDTNASFWFSAYDGDAGGFYTNVARDGSVISAWGRNKDVLTQSRNAYAMARAFQLTGDERYLDYARGALDFMYEHGWDTTYGGWLNRLGEDGSPLDPNGVKTAFNHHYALLGPMAMVEATGSEEDWSWLLRGYEYNDAILWDSRPDYFGYYDQSNRTGQIRNWKSFNATVDAVTTHVLQLYLSTGEGRYLTRLTELADNMLNRLVASMDAQAIGFAEKYNTNWGILPNERLTIMGHVLKTAWCLARTNQLSPRPEYVEAAERLANHVLDNAYDHEFGGPYKDYDRTTGEMMMWGIADTAKAWWQMEQAVVAGLELHRTTGKTDYLDMADESLDFFATYFQDPVYGEVYADRRRDGGAIPQWGDHKGNNGKAGYHSVETGYYAYLYAKLFLHREEATLHYRFEPAGEDRAVILSPLAAGEGDVAIRSVLLDGAEYADFDPVGRQLRIPAGVGGHFEIGFVAASAVANEVEFEPGTGFEIGANYPNPSFGRTWIDITLPSPGMLTIEVFDLAGRRVGSRSEIVAAAGRSKVLLETSGWPSGVYVYRVSSSDGSGSGRMVVVRP